jgi:manganese transport protein
VVASLVAILVQFQAAKLGMATGKSLPRLCRERFSRRGSLLLWLQAEVVVLATDLAEFVGAAIGMQLLFGMPPAMSALVTAVVALLMLQLRRHGRTRRFELVSAASLLLVGAGVVYDVAEVGRQSVTGLAGGLIPRLDGGGSLILAMGIVGATVMPHAIYLHSALIRDRHGRADPDCAAPMLRTIRLDVGLAMLVAGSVNVGMLLLAASTLSGLNVDGLQAAHSAIGAELGPLLAGLFALALLASGLASTSVGGYAGSVIMDGLLRRRIPIIWRRVLTAIPALILLALGLEPTRLLILSQVILSFGIPFALVPLVRIASDPELMHLVPTRRVTIAVAWSVIGIITALNVILIVLTVAGV